jgi:hypothetical protein
MRRRLARVLLKAARRLDPPRTPRNVNFPASALGMAQLQMQLHDMARKMAAETALPPLRY